MGSLSAVLAHGTGLPPQEGPKMRRGCYAGFINQSDQLLFLPKDLPLGIVKFGMDPIVEMVQTTGDVITDASGHRMLDENNSFRMYTASGGKPTRSRRQARQEQSQNDGKRVKAKIKRHEPSRTVMPVDPPPASRGWSMGATLSPALGGCAWAAGTPRVAGYLAVPYGPRFVWRAAYSPAGAAETARRKPPRRVHLDPTEQELSTENLWWLWPGERGRKLCDKWLTDVPAIAVRHTLGCEDDEYNSEESEEMPIWMQPPIEGLTGKEAFRLTEDIQRLQLRSNDPRTQRHILAAAIAADACLSAVADNCFLDEQSRVVWVPPNLDADADGELLQTPVREQPPESEEHNVFTFGAVDPASSPSDTAPAAPPTIAPPATRAKYAGAVRFAPPYRSTEEARRLKPGQEYRKREKLASADRG